MSTEPADRHIPFYCGSQKMDWHCYNCSNCTKGYDDEARAWRCDLEKAIDNAFMGDGSVSAEIAKRMGEPEDCRVHNWRCPEFVAAPPRPSPPKPAVNKPAYWIDEWLAKRNAKAAP